MELRRAIEEVNQALDNTPDSQILIQEMVRDPEVSGVTLAHALTDGSPLTLITGRGAPMWLLMALGLTRAFSDLGRSKN